MHVLRVQTPRKLVTGPEMVDRQIKGQRRCYCHCFCGIHAQGAKIPVILRHYTLRINFKELAESNSLNGPKICICEFKCLQKTRSTLELLRLCRGVPVHARCLPLGSQPQVLVLLLQPLGGPCIEDLLQPFLK